MCKECEFQVESNRNYISVQKILRHKESCSQKSKCVLCDKKCKTVQNMKRHMRDTHGMQSSSTSPPPKKKKAEVGKNDIADQIETTDEMEIDYIENEIIQEADKSDHVEAEITEIKKTKQ